MKKLKKDLKKSCAIYKKKLSASSETNFFARGKIIAAKADAGEYISGSTTLTFEDPDDLLKFVTAGKLQLLKCIRKNPGPLSKLAKSLKRTRSAVARDIKLLETYGLVHTELQTNPGHGLQKMVYPASKNPITIQSLV